MSHLPPEMRRQIVEELQSDPSAPISELSKASKAWLGVYSEWADRRLSALEFPPPRGKKLALARLAFAPEWKLLTSLPAAEGFERARRAFDVGSIFVARNPDGKWAPAFMESAPSADAGELRATGTHVYETGYLRYLELKAPRAEVGEFRAVWTFWTAYSATPVRTLLLYSRGRVAIESNPFGTIVDAMQIWNPTRTWRRWRATPETLAWKDKFVLARAEIRGPERAHPVLHVMCIHGLGKDVIGEDEVKERGISFASTVGEATALATSGKHAHHSLDQIYLYFGFGTLFPLRIGPGEAKAQDPETTLWSWWLSTIKDKNGLEPAIADMRGDPAWGYDFDSNLTEAVAGETRKGLLIMPAPIFFRFLLSHFTGWKFLTRWGEVEIDGHTMTVVALPGTDPKAFAPHDIVWLDDAVGPEELARLTLQLKRGRVLEL
jgi:hypothetical protein